MKRSHLSNKILIGCGVFAAALILCTCFAVGGAYWNEKMDEYGSLAFSYARIAAQYIDGDRVAGYAETGEEDDYYRQVMGFLNATQMQTDLKYYYVFIPYEEDLVYVWDADNAEGACPLGYHEEYMEGGKEAVEKIYRQNPPEEISIVHDEVYGYIASAYSPIFDSSGQPVAVVGVDLSMPGIQMVMLHFILVIVLCIAAATVVLAAVFSTFIRRKVAAPIALLNTAAREMVGHLEREEDFQPDIHTGDEIEELADSFSQMNREVREYIHRLAAVTAEKERIGAELSVAAQIQNDMLPRIFPAFPEREEFDVYALMRPAKEVGGDFYDFYLLGENRLAFLIADVSGKGVPAALFMMTAKTIIKNLAETGLAVQEIFTRANAQLCENNEAGMFVTAWMGILDFTTGEMEFANAGHNPPVIRRKDGAFEYLKTRPGFVLGGMEGVRYRKGELPLQPGDQIYLYTDGVTEATDQSQTLYGEARLLEALNRCGQSGDVQMLCRTVLQDVDAFAGDAPQFDDITMLAVKLNDRGDERMDHWAELSVFPSLESIGTVTAFIEDKLGEAGVPMKATMQVNVAVDEIFSNIARYSGATESRVGCRLEENRLTLRFSDNGAPYDPTSRPAPDITLSAEEREIGGLGILMVQKTMDAVRYEYKDGQNLLTIEKTWQAHPYHQTDKEMNPE